ncbi:MAG TPA: hypothetical protein VFI97_01965 [Arthrobacter sp.]|nr:hypothetical protein [Arthrobacter sp.]
MNDQDMKKVRVAAADLESVEFERDHAAMDLDDAVNTAVGHGESVEDVARAANMDTQEVTNQLDTTASMEEHSGSAEEV